MAHGRPVDPTPAPSSSSSAPQLPADGVPVRSTRSHRGRPGTVVEESAPSSSSSPASSHGRPVPSAILERLEHVEARVRKLERDDVDAPKHRGDDGGALLDQVVRLEHRLGQLEGAHTAHMTGDGAEHTNYAERIAKLEESIGNALVRIDALESLEHAVAAATKKHGK